VRDAGPALLIYSALGGPPESVAVLEPAVRRAIESLPAAERAAARNNWLILPASLAYRDFPFASLQELAADDPIVEIERAAALGDSGAVRQGLARQRRLASSVAPSAFTFDGLFPLASLDLWLGAPRDAALWLDAPLAAISTKAPEVLASPAGIACLIRAMALRAEVADRLHDREGARRWARAVVTLWSGADPFLQHVVGRQRELMM